MNTDSNNLNTALVELTNEKLTKDGESKLVIVATAIVNGYCTTADDIAQQFGITFEQSVSLLNHPRFLNLLNNLSQSRTQLLFHSKVINKLEKILESEDNKESLQAIKLISQLSNNLKSNGTDVNINLSLESLIKQEENKEKQINKDIIDIQRENADR